MSDALIEDIKKLTAFKPVMTTAEVVKYLNDKSIYRSRLYKEDMRLMLGAKRIGAGVHYVFDTAKVLMFKVNNN